MSESVRLPAPRLELAARVEVRLAAPRSLGQTQWGERRLVEILGGSFEGPRLRGVVLPGGADWQVIHAEINQLIDSDQERAVNTPVDPLGGEAVGPRTSPARAALASFVGTATEYYDFFIYGTASALVFGQLFFPNVSPLAGTLSAFAAFGVGFLFRPLGGIFSATTAIARPRQRSAPSETPVSYVVDKDVVVEMRDGARLATDVYRPTGAAPTPVLLLRTPYDKERMLAVTAVYANIPRFVGAGYTIAVQDVRGRFGSDGVFVPQSDLETADGEDTIAWAASQGWSTGRVGMFGASYQSTTQLLAGVARPPALAALALSVTPSDFYATLAYPGGAFGLGVHLGWYLGIAQNASARRVHAGELQPSVQADGLAALEAFGDACERTPLADQALLEATTPMYRTWLEHPARDAFWQRLSLDGRHAAINAPGLHIGGWYDLFLRGTLNNFSELARAGNAPQRLIFGPWAHVNQLGARFRSSNSAKWSR